MRTTPHWTAGLAAAALCAFGQTAQAPQLAILMKFDVEPPAPVVEAMQSEVTQIFEPAGIKVVWRPGAERRH
jgi:hypothetical protein